MRAIGKPDWMVSIVVSQAARMLGKRAMPGGDRLRNPGEPEHDLDDDSERAFRADEEMGEVVAGGGLLRPRAGAHERSVGDHHAERQHEVLHRAVAHCIGARGAGRGHAAERGVGARIDGKEEPAVAQVLVELLAGDAGFDDAVEIVGVDGENVVHAREVERDAAVGRIDVAFERRADAERNDRRVVAGAKLDEVDHVLLGLGEHHRVRRLVLEPGQRVPVRLADRLGGGEAIAETGGKVGIERGDRFGREAALALADGELGHGVSRFPWEAKIRRAAAAC